MSNISITYAQARSLVDTGAMSEDAFNNLVESGVVSVFNFRKLKNSYPTIVKEVHQKMLSIANENELELYSAGFVPSIKWTANKIKVSDEVVE